MTTTIHRSALSGPGDLAGWHLEGPAVTSFPAGRLRLESGAHPGEGQAANVVAWLPVTHEGDVRISWSFRPLHEPGLAMIFWAARGRDGQDVLDPALPTRSGEYEQYHSGAIDAYHLSYYRRMWPSERALHTLNVRKSHGFHLVAQGPDPLPAAIDAEGDHRIELTWRGAELTVEVAGLVCLRWTDDGGVGGPARRGGRIGLRQMAPLVAEYSDLLVEAI
ncbi:YesU family protein [Brachybacterium sp. NBEC-018]|uniref:YesU family protein n=1 Tax=Brachybacterium sp. NBEC-018 TaxID=2996004 RepID=UPI002174F5CE|nr:YesU family protein [Brachybacterium sp. NBEC-018]UVY84896.1 YesU family protein [Brachybacterium sp. NBEC-018]